MFSEVDQDPEVSLPDVNCEIDLDTSGMNGLRWPASD